MLVLLGHTNKYKKPRRLVKCHIGQLEYYADYSSYKDWHDEVELYKCKRDKYHFACKLPREDIGGIVDGTFEE